MRIKKIITVLMFVLYISAFFIPLTTFASTGDIEEKLNVNAVWIEGELLQIDVTNISTGEKQKLELRLKDYTDDSEYVSIQAIDLDGNKSNIVQVKNPYYKPTNKESTLNIDNNIKNESIISNSTAAFTPNGTGEVMDNVKDDSKEFFTIKTKNDNVFHLIIDRQRGSDNVYLLNDVTEEDLIALAKKNNKNAISAIPIQQEPVEKSTSPQEPEQTKPIESKNSSIGIFIIICFIVFIISGISYYFKIYRPKHIDTDNSDDIDEYDEDYEDEDYEDVSTDEKELEE